MVATLLSIFAAFSSNMSNEERTFIMVKPDGVQRGLVGEIITRFEKKGYKLVAMKFMKANEDLLRKHYAEHVEKSFFKRLLAYMLSGPVVPMVWEGVDVVISARKMMGATNPKDSAPGTIRGDLALDMGRNVIHGSDAVETAKTEMGLWFTDKELVSHDAALHSWLYE
ncbi:nucleoside diphosphate kinase-like [Tubulanus polymorphus]|uniref:nucleoside diphosphate kinase-like n=1 Tax=Tubulanus polymorphus TaxID=672921 RepID=UPI003DA22293